MLHLFLGLAYNRLLSGTNLISNVLKQTLLKSLHTGKELAFWLKVDKSFLDVTYKCSDILYQSNRCRIEMKKTGHRLMGY